MTDVAQDPFDVFEEEHRHALGELDRLEQAIDGLQQRRDIDADLAAVRAAHAFLSSSVRAHNEREEQALFPFLDEDAPTRLFVEEHERLRGLERRLLAALDDTRAAELVIEPALDVVHLLRAHIRREDEALFPMARAMLGAEGTARVGRELSRLMGVGA